MGLISSTGASPEAFPFRTIFDFFMGEAFASTTSFFLGLFLVWFSPLVSAPELPCLLSSFFLEAGLFVPFPVGVVGISFSGTAAFLGLRAGDAVCNSINGIASLTHAT